MHADQKTASIFSVQKERLTRGVLLRSHGAQGFLYHTPNRATEGINLDKLRLQSGDGLACIRRLVAARNFYTCAVIALLRDAGDHDWWEDELRGCGYWPCSEKMAKGIWEEFQLPLGKPFNPDHSGLWTFGEVVYYQTRVNRVSTEGISMQMDLPEWALQVPEEFR